MIYLPFAREKRIWLPSPYLRGAGITTPFWGAATTSLGTSTSNSTTGLPFTITSSVKKDDLIIRWAVWTPNANTDTVVFTDSAGHTYTTVVKRTDSGGSFVAVALGVAKCVTPLTSGSSTFTSTATTSPTGMLVGGVKETSQNWLGIVDGSNSIQAAASATISPGTLTTTVNYVWMVQAFANQDAPGKTGTAGGGFTELWDIATPAGTLHGVINVANQLIEKAGTVTNVSETWSTAPANGVGCQMALRFAAPFQQSIARHQGSAVGRAGSW